MAIIYLERSPCGWLKNQTVKNGAVKAPVV